MKPFANLDKDSFATELESMSNAELTGMYRKRNEYEDSFIEMVYKEMLSRGFDFVITDDNQAILRKRGKYIIMGYLLSACGIIVGLGFGVNYAWTEIKIEGRWIPKYDEPTRKHGRRMVFLYLVIFFIVLVGRLAWKY